MKLRERNQKQIRTLEEVANMEIPYTDKFEWEEEVWAKENGLYKPAGLLKLPFKGERTHEKKPFSLWTSFHPAYQEGILVMDGYWCPREDRFQDTSDHSDHWLSFKNEKLTRKSLIVTHERTPESAIQTHIQKYFGIRKSVLDGKKKLSEVERMNLLGCFTEYK